MINQLNLDNKYRIKISEFLIIKNEGNIKSYNNRLEKLKINLMRIPYHDNFTNDLRYLTEEIEKPVIMQAEAHYKRIKTWYQYFFGDRDIRKPAPEIFDKPLCLIYYEPHLIGRFDKTYVYRKPVGYIFPIKMNLLGIPFELEGIFIKETLFNSNQYLEYINKNGFVSST
jgi:hypothetical protein